MTHKVTSARLTNLWDMLSKYAEDFYQLGAALHVVKAYLNPALLLDDIPEDRREEIKQDASRTMLLEHVLPGLARRCESLKMTFTQKAVLRIESAFQEKATSEDLREVFNDIDRRVRDELSERHLYFVTPEKARHYIDFRRGWEAALARFDIAHDVEEAEKCFALERWTACVFHLMRISEIAVQEIGAYFNLSPEALAESWGNIVNAVAGPVKKIPDKTERAKFSMLVDDLFHVNFAWRVPTDHPRVPGAQYSEEQAAEALNRVKALMSHLAALL